MPWHWLHTRWHHSAGSNELNGICGAYEFNRTDKKEYGEMETNQANCKANCYLSR